MFVAEDGTVVTSPSDLTVATKCEFAFVRRLDARLGRIAEPPQDDDPMLRRAAVLGDQHEAAILERYRDQYDTLVEVPRPAGSDQAARDEALARTKAAFDSGADVVFQAAFFDGEMLGYADFVVRQPDGTYQVRDSKLARSAKVEALLQLAAYAEQLDRIDVPVAATVQLLLGDGTVSEHALTDIFPVYRERRDRLRQIVADRREAAQAVAWGDAQFSACGRCVVCEPEVVAARDLLLVAGMRSVTRAKLLAAGIATIDELATSSGPVEGVTAGTLDKLRLQARLQVRAVEGERPPYEVVDPTPIADLPLPDPGDIFFDFEGDPLYAEAGEEDETRWGLDYLFGLVEADGTFRAFWAHNLDEERVALRQFLNYLAERRARFPGMHVYHYAPYERIHLLSIAARHGVGEQEVADLLRDGVLVDLYPGVRHVLRVGDRSYSLKTIEKLFLDEGRSGEVTTGIDSVEEYAHAQALRQAGREAEAEPLLQQIADYNEEDCRSTLALRDWLLARGAERGVRPGTAPPAEEGPTNDASEGKDVEESPVALELRRLAGEPSNPNRTPDQWALGLASAAVDYFRREDRAFWWGHFFRLDQPVEDWAETRDVLIVDQRASEREIDWHREGRQRALRRQVRLRGELAPGSTLKEGDPGVFLVYPPEGPRVAQKVPPKQRQSHSRTQILEVGEDMSFLVEERLTGGGEQYDDLPLALTPSAPPRADSLVDAIGEWATRLLSAQTEGSLAAAERSAGGFVFPRDAVVDILRRTPPRTRSGRGLESATSPDDTIRAILASLKDLDRSYLAVQGPPGTGKTYTGAHVIAALVREGWKIGVVAQSHATIENMLHAVLDAGVDRKLVAKASRNGTDSSVRWEAIHKEGISAFLAADSGRVLGGTAWDFSNATRVPRGALDLLVIDEAGQFSLAQTIASGVAAQNLLLLGDPQQLPQVSQGIHPEPVDGSALGWIGDGHDVLPSELGYFLPTSRRMAGPLARAVSALSYEGALTSHPSADARRLTGIPAGVHPIEVPHRDRATESPEEAERIVQLVHKLLGTEWHDPGASPVDRRLVADDIIVVAPYNAQVTLVHDRLRDAQLGGVRVGTVDKFQGQQAVVAIVTLAASSPADVPRGMEFLIMRNRINVAISRAQWAAYVVHSPALVDYVPRTPRALAELSAFLRIVRSTDGPGTDRTGAKAPTTEAR